MRISFGTLLLAGCLSTAAGIRAEAHPDWKAWSGMTPEQQKRFEAANKNKAAKEKPWREKEKQSIENLRNQVEAKAGEDAVKAAFADVRLASKSIREAENGFSDTLAAFLTTTEQAKWLLKNHPPRNAAPASGKPPNVPEDSAHKQADRQAAEAWRQSFALTPDQKKQFDAAQKAKSETMKRLQAEKESALEQLDQKVEAKAPDADIQAPLESARRALAAIPAAEDAYWDGLAGFLAPTQQAKLFLKGKPKK
jgi:hypothetical protein